MWWYNNKSDSMISMKSLGYGTDVSKYHGLKHIMCYVQKHTAALVMCYNPALVRDKPLGVPASVELVY